MEGASGTIGLEPVPGPGPQAPLEELYVRGPQDVWVAMNRDGPRRMWAVLEGGGDSLLEAHAAVQRLDTEHLGGVFSELGD